jgi:hypothetical protein
VVYDHGQAVVGGDDHGWPRHPAPNPGYLKKKKRFTEVSLVPSRFLDNPLLFSFVQQLARDTADVPWLWEEVIWT